MENERHYFIVGLFVIGGALALLAFTMWLTVKSDSDYQRYRIRFAESVSGLSNGSPVKFRGVNVGNVESIVIDPDDSRLIRVDIELLKSTPVKKDTSAGLKLQGITGQVFIELSGGDPSSPDIARNISSDEIPVIPAQQSSLDALINRVPILLDKISQTIDQLNKIASDENIHTLGEVLKNSNSAVGDLRGAIAGSRQNLDAATSDAAATMHHLRNASRNAEDITENPSSLLFPPAEKGIPAP